MIPCWIQNLHFVKPAVIRAILCGTQYSYFVKPAVIWMHCRVWSRHPKRCVDTPYLLICSQACTSLGKDVIWEPSLRWEGCEGRHSNHSRDCYSSKLSSAELWAKGNHSTRRVHRGERCDVQLQRIRITSTTKARTSLGMYALEFMRSAVGAARHWELVGLDLGMYFAKVEVKLCS